MRTSADIYVKENLQRGVDSECEAAFIVFEKGALLEHLHFQGVVQRYAGFIGANAS